MRQEQRERKCKGEVDNKLQLGYVIYLSKLLLILK